MQLLDSNPTLIELVRYAKSQEEQKRKKAAEERLKIYCDNYKGIIDDTLRQMFVRESYDTLRRYIDVSQNITKRIVDEVSSVYDEDAVRTVETSSGAEVERYDQLAESMQLDLRMDKANKYVNLLNELVIKVTPRGEGLSLDYLTPNIVTVFQATDDPSRVDALVYSVPITGDNGEDSVHWVVWTPTEHAVFTDNFERLTLVGNEDGVNPYAAENLANDTFAPFIFLHRQHPEDSFFDPHTGSDFVEATKTVAIRNTFINMMFVLNFKQIWVSADKIEVPGNQVKDPLMILQLSGQGATAGMFDYSVDLPGLTESNNRLIFQVANSYGISSENFTLSADTTSGFARKIANAALTRNRKRQIKLWRDYEQQLFDIMRVVNNAHYQEKIDEAAEFSIDFGEQDYEDDPGTVAELWQKKIEAGVASILDWLRYENPDLRGASDEEVEEVLTKNLQYRARVRDRFGLSGIRGLMNGQADSQLPGQAGAARGADQAGGQQPTV